MTWAPVWGFGRRSSSTLCKLARGRCARLAKEQERDAVAQAEQMLVSAHLVNFPAAETMAAPAPEAVDRKALEREHKRQALKGISLFARATRKAAKEQAAQMSEKAVRLDRR